MARKSASATLPAVAGLSFVASRDGKTMPKAKGDQCGRCFWNVTATGDYEQDCNTGVRLALEYLAFEEADSGGGGHLQSIVDMPRLLTGVEIGFLQMVSFAAGVGAKEARRISAYWDCCEKREAEALP
jgi:hypothetical protein